MNRALLAELQRLSCSPSITILQGHRDVARLREPSAHR